MLLSALQPNNLQCWESSVCSSGEHNISKHHDSQCLLMYSVSLYMHKFNDVNMSMYLSHSQPMHVLIVLLTGNFNDVILLYT